MSDDIEKAQQGGYPVADGTMAKGQAAQELGTSGLKGARPGEGWLYEEFVPQLRGISGAKKFREMADNDPILGAALFAFKMLLRNVDWTVVPADESDEAAAAKEWLETVLFQDMLTPFSAVIEDILSFLQYGFAPAEVVFKVRAGEKRDPRKSSAFDDRTIGVAKIAVRAQDTVWRWHFDDYGELKALEQWRIGQTNAMIPAEKLLNFVTEHTLGNPEGRSVLRNSYTTYIKKNTIEEAEGRAALRTAGVVLVRIPSKYLDPNASGDELAIGNAYRGIGDKLAKDAMGSLTLPSERDQNTKEYLVDVSYMTTDTGSAKGVDMSAIVERYDKRMLSSLMADFILLGQQAVGSFALSDSKTAMFGKACGAFLGIIGDQFTRRLVPLLWKLNAFKPELKPKLKPGDLENVDLDKLGMFILRMSQAGAQMFPDPALDAEIREIAGLPSTVDQG